MAVALESVAPKTETRSDRWVRSITLHGVLKYVPAASAIAVPISFVLAHAYAVGYASSFGIPRDFVHVGPEAAVTPFLVLLALLALTLPIFSDVERHGVIGTVKYYGSTLRIVLFGFGIGLYVVEIRRGELSLLVAFVAALLAYVMLWWLPPFIAWVARWIVRGLGIALGSVGHRLRRPIEIVVNHLFRSIPAASPSAMLTFAKLMLIVVVLFAAYAAPQGLGMLVAETQEEFPVIVGVRSRQRSRSS